MCRTVFKSGLLLLVACVWGTFSLAQELSPEPPEGDSVISQDTNELSVITEGVVENEKLVSVEYVLSIDGAVFDSNKEKTPLVFIQGRHHVLPKFEEHIAGLAVGQTKQFSLSVTEGYGPVNPEALVEVPKEKIPADALQVGATLQTQSPDGRLYTGTLQEIKEGTVVIDFNHPLAGKNLDFEVKILSVEDAPEPQQTQQIQE